MAIFDAEARRNAFLYLQALRLGIIRDCEYHCKSCGCIVEATIEGELVCSPCWSRSQMTEEERNTNDEIEHALTHCADCNKRLKGEEEHKNMRCTKCERQFLQEIEEMKEQGLW